MAKNKKSITSANILMIFALVILSIISLNLWMEQEDYEKEIEVLKTQLELEKEDTLLYEKTKEFINKIANGNFYEMLTSTAQEQLEKRLEEQGTDYHESGALANVEIFNINAFKTSEDTAISYGIYRIYYDLDKEFDIPARQQIITMAIKINWKKEKNEYKVNKYEFNLLKDSLDSYLQDSLHEGDHENEGNNQ